MILEDAPFGAHYAAAMSMARSVPLVGGPVDQLRDRDPVSVDHETTVQVHHGYPPPRTLHR